MTSIIKTEAIVLKKIDFSNSSLIVNLYSKDFGKISAILKGAKSSKSKLGMKVDMLNHLEVVIYRKEEREVQTISQTNLINHFPIIKTDLEKLKYSTAIMELILKLIPENEKNEKLFKALVRILNLINKVESDSLLFFTKFLIYFIKEIGFEISFTKCFNCGKNIDDSSDIGFNYSEGFLCSQCNKEKLSSFKFSEELFNLVKCLSSKNDISIYTNSNLKNIIFVFEKFLIFHNPEFKGIKSLQIL